MYLYTKYICAQQISCRFNLLKLKKVQLDDKIKPTRILAEIMTIAKYIHIHLKYIPY